MQKPPEYFSKLPTLEQIHWDYKKLTEFLIENNFSITTMESCTSGFIASLITDTEGSSAIFKGACITYSNEAKILNGVEQKIIENSGVYSVQTAKAMADAVQKIYPSNIGIGITGTFGNVDPNNKDSVPGKIYFALSLNFAENSKLVTKELTLPVNISRFQSKLCVAKAVVEEIKLMTL